MKKFVLILGLFINVSYAQEMKRCGMDELNKSLTAKHPDLRLGIRAIGAQAKRYAGKGDNAQYVIPVVFHVIVNEEQYNRLGGQYGIIDRISSQLVSINNDFNAENSDSSLIPSCFRDVYANTGISFRLAHTAPDGRATSGYEISMTGLDGFDFNGTYGSGESFSNAKYSASDGMDAWDPTSYLNVWVINTIYQGGGIAGLTIPPSYISIATGIPISELGIIINYATFGVRSSPDQYFIYGLDKGRTLTHELGHYFELKHIWGDDDVLCPEDDGGNDDGVEDTPPQQSATLGCPSFPKYDKCSANKNGIMFMNYMDYTDDECMCMFSIGQSKVMVATLQAGEESFSLLRHPFVFEYPGNSVGDLFTISPNPSSGWIYLLFNQPDTQQKQVTITNDVGQVITSFSTTLGYYPVDLSAVSKGLYFVKVYFRDKSMIKRILIN
ncbi:MAG: hypothetical protein BGO69_04825 [Bacteroidetes bacterium 46-16]|nr:MAG: hypothetical protein BGO69_04825 [Bacteroidetes bacterium 46-16]